MCDMAVNAEGRRGKLRNSGWAAGKVRLEMRKLSGDRAVDKL